MKTPIPPVLITLLLVCFALVQNTQAQEEFANGNTAGGKGALESLTTGARNTALGAGALHENTTGNNNTATGSQALRNNTSADNNTATGRQALTDNTTGSANVADGEGALRGNTTGRQNVAAGIWAMEANRTGDQNTAVGAFALRANTAQRFNTAVGAHALEHATNADNNIALGYVSGFDLTTGDNNIDIGNRGVAGESGTIRIGSASQVRTFIAGINGAMVTGAIVQVNAAGQLGVSPSAARFKEEIKPIDKASEALFALKPVSFHYNRAFDPDGIPQFGLVAEDVEKVNPALILRDAKGKPYTVRYDQVNAMLLNEFLKEHKTVQEQGATIAELKKEIAGLATTVKEQAAQIEKVRAQLDVRRPAPQTVLNNQ